MMRAFVDYAKIFCHAGDGGNGCVSFRREKYVPRGGPNGGDGGNGGSVWLETEPKLVTLLDCKLNPHYKAGRGEHGRGKNQHGRNGDDCTVPVPLGTVVTILDEENQAIDQVDLVESGQRMLAARGGGGGRGNARFASPTNRAPRRCEEGRPGEQRVLILELKMIAQVGLIGLPNAGKSTLLSNLTRATPKIASYPFTTLHPNLGILQVDGGEQLTLADIPGLIEGAHRGQGLGLRFLRHIERTRLLVHLVAIDPDELNFENLWEGYEIVRRELASYSQRLTETPEIVVLNKTDLLGAARRGDLEKIMARFRERGIAALAVSARRTETLAPLRGRLIEDLHAIEKET